MNEREKLSINRMSRYRHQDRNSLRAQQQEEVLTFHTVHEQTCSCQKWSAGMITSWVSISSLKLVWRVLSQEDHNFHWGAGTYGNVAPHRIYRWRDLRYTYT